LHLGLSIKGQEQEAMQIIEAMLDRDPLYNPAFGNAVFQYMLRGKADKAMRLIERVRPFLTDDPILAKTEALMLNYIGRSSESLPLARFAYQRLPTNRTAYSTLANALGLSNQFEQLVDIKAPIPGFKVNALLYLGRSEEASILAYQWANSGQTPGPLFNTLVKTGQFKELIDYLEDRWADLDVLAAAFPARFGFGNQMMLNVARAYHHIGNQVRFEQALELFKQTYDQHSLAGADSASMYVALAQYWVLAGEPEMAMDALQIFADRNGMATPRLSDFYPLLKPLEGEPRFDAIQKQMLEHLNSERSKLSLKPLGQGKTS
jgi:tetratricopeptide (TPR) repeat protein